MMNGVPAYAYLGTHINLEDLCNVILEQSYDEEHIAFK
jgi:hypothetical protein